MSDLLNSIGKKKETSSASTVTTKVSDFSEATGEALIANQDNPSDYLKRGDNVINKAIGTGSKTSQEVETSVENEASEVVSKTVKNPDDWSKDSALKEVTKLREENKAYRVKHQEQLDRLQKEKEAEIAKIRQEAQSANDAKKKLEALEAAAEDKKRTLEEKLANREARIVETETVLHQKLKEKEAEVETYRTKALQYEAEQAARQQVFKDRIKEEMAAIPEEFKPLAELMVKGAEDSSQAWTALSEAKMKGMFGEKKVVINHSVPGAADGARINKAKADAEAREDRKARTSKDLIRSGLDKITVGKQANTAFRTR
jgi:hypothetical protein